ncbi:MAG: hypothetical protein RLZZ28_2337 [Bacteroidota bacterium]|jgi:uncharacterized RDD family membrane protein YckC
MKTAGEGSRALNFFIDTLIIFGLSFFGFKTWNWYVLNWGYQSHNFGWFFFGILFLYYFLFEGFFAKTPGKWFTYTKVVNKQGNKPNLLQIFLRSLGRLILIDLFFIPFIGKPLHDFVSKTELVES